MRWEKKDKKGKGRGGVVARCAVICIVAAFIGSSIIPVSAEAGLPALQTVQTEETVVRVNAPAVVNEGETFEATIDVDKIAELNSGQFDLSFDSDVVNVVSVADGCLDGVAVPVDKWEFVDADTIRVILEVSGIAGVSGTGNLAKINFTVVGEREERSVLNISNGLLVNTDAEEIPADWTDDEVLVGPTEVRVNAPEEVEEGETFDVTIDVGSVVNLNIAQFDLSFDSDVVEVKEVAAGCIDDTEMPISAWNPIDSNTIRVISELSGGAGVSGSGYLAKITFEVKGEGGDETTLDLSNGLLYNNEGEELPADWFDAEVSVKIEIEIPTITVKTDKAVYEPGETQKISLTVENSLTRAVQVNLGMSFHAFEVAGEPYLYEWEFLETGLFWLPAESVRSFELPVEGLVLPEGEYAWSAYLENAVGMTISESVAKFSVRATEFESSTATNTLAASTVPMPNEEVFREMRANLNQQAASAEVLAR